MKFSVPLKENHKALWNWLAKNPDKEKRHWPGWKTIEKVNTGEYSELLWMMCFACEECVMDCRKCPCDWGVKPNRYVCENLKSSSYNQWKWAINFNKRSRLALKIAEAWR